MKIKSWTNVTKYGEFSLLEQVVKQQVSCRNILNKDEEETQKISCSFLSDMSSSIITLNFEWALCLIDY